MIKPCYDKWWEWSHCIECAMCCGENDCKYHDQFTPDEAEAEKERAIEEVEKRLEPAQNFIHFLSNKYGIDQGYLEASIYKIIDDNSKEIIGSGGSREVEDASGSGGGVGSIFRDDKCRFCGCLYDDKMKGAQGRNGACDCSCGHLSYLLR